MKRSAIENGVRQPVAHFKTWVIANPVQGFFAGLAVGICLIALRGLFLPIILFTALVLAALWVFADEDRPEQAEFYERQNQANENPPVNGAATASEKDSLQ